MGVDFRQGTLCIYNIFNDDKIISIHIFFNVFLQISAAKSIMIENIIRHILFD